MSPKKAIIIVLILFLLTAAVFAFLYFKKQQSATGKESINNQESGQIGNQTGNKEDKPLTPAEVTQQKIDKIIEDSKNDPTASPDTVREDVVSTVNDEIMKQEENKTPEQKAADLKAQEDRQKIIDQINNQIK
jgi:flagellar basal body-associated protein FliL